MRITTSRLGALVALSALTLSGVTGLATPAQAVGGTDPRPVTIGASWLEGQLVNGLLPSQFPGFDDYGLTIDAGLSLAEIGGHASTVSAIAAALAPKIANGYAQSDEYDFNPPYDFVQKGLYANATAKALVFAQVAGQNTATWAGVDLVDALEDRVSAAAPITGRIADDSFYGDYGNTIGQAFAARALGTASSGKAADVLAFLLDQQCSAGFFRLSFTTSKAALDQACDGGSATESAPDTDVTALTVLQLSAMTPTPAITAAIADAEDWLISAQRADGSFGGGATTEAPNTNSTGLAGWALGDLGDTAAATKSAVWVRQHQADELSGCANGLSSETGALAYDGDALATGRTSGITTAAQDQWRRATAPTLPVLAYAPSAIANLNVSGPAGYLKAGSTVGYGVSGVVPGDKVCLTAFGTSRTVVAGPAGTATVPLKLPAGTADRLIGVGDRGGNSASVLSNVLGTKVLTVAAPTRAKRSARIAVTVRGLKPAERVVITLRGVRIRAGFADTRGVFSTHFRVGRKLGRAAVRAYGKFPDIRRGVDVVRVVR